MQPKKIVIIGGGSAGMMAAEQLDSRYEVHLYEQGKTLGRKFLVAGKGGFNLTNQATGTALYQHYSKLPALQQALRQFDSQAMRAWLADLGIVTYVGSSRRVFPLQGTKPIQVLQALRQRLINKGVHLHYQHCWQGFDAQERLLITNKDGATQIVEADYYIFALGGASWAVTGSNQRWLAPFQALGIATPAFQASNCGIEIPWPSDFKARFAGQPLKNIAVSVEGFQLQGEALITDYGLEGNLIYPLVPALRPALKKHQKASFSLDLKPYTTTESLQKTASTPRLLPKNYVHAFKLQKAAFALAKLYTNKNTYLNPSQFAEAIKNLKITATSLRPIEEAISTVGGIDTKEIQNHFSLQQKPSMFVIGEMLDWDAPTGGFLLQGCFSTASVCAHHLNQQLKTI
ncbi:MAG: NAD(P)/FAD-dependent oxidoreductase [Aureispira sp.]